MLKVFKRLTVKERLMMLLSVEYVCVEVWANLKVPDHMSRITK
nr:hypothetical protein [Streptococcus hyointestinalis]